MDKSLEVNVELWSAALKPEDTKNVQQLIPVVKSHIKGHKAIFAAVGSSVRKTQGDKKKYRDIDFAIVSENLPQDDYWFRDWFKILTRDIGDKLGWSFLDSRGESRVFRSNYGLAKYALNDSIDHTEGNFTGNRIYLCPKRDYSLRKSPSLIDLMLVSGSKFGEKEYGGSVDDWLKAQKEQELPYVILARF